MVVGRLVGVGEFDGPLLAGVWPGAGGSARPASSVTFIRSVPLAPSRMTRVPSGMSRTRGSMPATAGMSSARARIATCEDAPPAVVQKPTTLVGSRDTVSDGVRSSAIRIEPAGISACSRRWPVIS